MNKNDLRKNLQEQLSSISKPYYEHYSYLISQQLYNDEEWKNAKTIGMTISNPPEVDTFQIIRKAWEEGKKVVIPKCYPKERKMAFRKLSYFSQLESVYSGLLEPIETETEEVLKDQIDMLIVPGLAFTVEGYRLGFGGGYYDRYLKDYKGKTISLAFQVQILSSLPIEEHDIPVGKIISI